MNEPRTSAAPADARLLTNVAYRLLGTIADAEDAVQDAYARWYALSPAQRNEIRSPAAWLVTTVSRICLDVLKSARVRRETYVGEWLPEPVSGAAAWTQHVGDAWAGDPHERAGVDESLRMAFLVICQAMTPAERIAFVLHDVFAYRFTEIAGILDRSPQACRQLAATGRRRLRQGTGPTVPPATNEGLVTAFAAAWQSGDLTDLVRQLDPDAIAIADGGGVVIAAPAPVHGALPVAQVLLDVLHRTPGLAIATARVNGEPGLVARDEAGAIVAVLSLHATHGRIDRLWVMRNPHKLTTWQ